MTDSKPDTTQPPVDSPDAPPEDNNKRVHLLVQKATHEELEVTRVMMRNAGLGSVPEPVKAILLRDWTSDTLVSAGCKALQYLLSPAPEPATSPKAEICIGLVMGQEGIDRHQAITRIIERQAEALGYTPQMPAASKKKR